MNEIKNVVPVVNSLGIISLLAFNLKKFKDIEERFLELEHELKQTKTVDNSELFEKLNKKIEDMVPLTEVVKKNKDVEDVEEIVTLKTKPTEEDVDMAINELQGQ